MRLWRLGNMSEAHVTGESFTRDPDFDLEAYARRSFGTFQEKPMDVVLRFSAEAKRDAAAFLFHPSQTMEENADGTLTVPLHRRRYRRDVLAPRNLGRESDDRRARAATATLGRHEH